MMGKVQLFLKLFASLHSLSQEGPNQYTSSVLVLDIFVLSSCSFLTKLQRTSHDRRYFLKILIIFLVVFH